jgi:hypothetical protein
MHPIITKIGYHNRGYFLGQWDKFRNRPWGDSAHSTHMRGQGRWDPEHGEQNRVAVTLRRAYFVHGEIYAESASRFLPPPRLRQRAVTPMC